MNKQLIKTAMIAIMAMFGVLYTHAQGKAPWTVTKHWITPGGGTVESMNEQYMDAWIYGKKAKGRCEDESNAICNGGISISWKDDVIAYVILNYAGKNAKGYIYNATYKQKGGTPVTGKLLIRVKGNQATGPSIDISAITGTLEGCDVDGVTLIGTPTTMEE